MGRIQSNIDEKKTAVEKSKEENQRLQDEVKVSKTDQYMEKLAREKLDLIKGGETPVINTKGSK
jgi:cell division protein FtsB